MTERDDEAWRAIVENYGERAALDDAPGDSPGETTDPPEDAAAGADQDGGDQPGGSPDPAIPEPSTSGPADGRSSEDPDASIARALADGERFVPPPAPPLPYVAPPRLAAGLGVFGGPLVLLVCVVGGFSLPGWLGYLLVAAFVGGFGYLVAHMKKRPDDPWDDGARV